MESDKHVDDSEVAPTDSTEADSDKEEFFRCGVPECKVSYCDVASLKNHMKTCHASMKIYPCPYCSCLWSDHNSLIDHILTHVGPKPYRCVQCDICFVTHSQLKNHLDTSHHVKKLLKCQVDGCGYVSKLWTEFKVHIWNCHPAEDEYTCFACDATFTSPSAYLRHLESGMETLICCAYCPMTSKLRYSIIRHLGSVHQGLRTSVKVQTDVKCGKRNKLTLRKCTPQKQAFKPLVRPVLYQCTLCDFVDDDKTLVDVHIENHKSIRDTNLAFSCEFCTFGSNDMQQYAQHLANHRIKVTHQLRYFRCSYCVFTSNQMPLVEKHLEKKHSERPFKFEVQQATVTTNRQEANVGSNGRQAHASAGGQHDEATMQKPHASCDLGSSKHQNNASTGPSVRKKVVVVPRSGNDKKPHVSGDLKDSSKHPRPASTGSSLHKRLLIVLERCSVPKTTTQNKAAPRLRAKRKSTSDDDDDVTRRHAKRGRKLIETGVAKDQSKAVRRSTEIPADDKTHHRDTSLTYKYEVGDREQMFSEEEEDDSYWREMIRKSTSPEQYAAQEVPSVRSTTGRLDRGSIAGTPIPHDEIRPNRKEPQNYSKSGVSVDECDSDGVEPMSEDDDSFWRDVIRKRNNPGEMNKTQSKTDDIVEDEKAVEDIFVSEEDEEEDDTFWRNVVRRSKRDQHSESTCDQPTTVGRICRAPVVSRTCEDGSRDRLPRGVDFIGPHPATPGSSSTPSLTIANYNCTLCEFSCNDWQLFDDHVRSSHENMSADTLTGTSIAKTERSSRKRVVATAVGRVAGLAGCSTTDADAIVSCDDNEMRYHCYLCSIDCPNWKTFESHMSGAHSYNVIKSETTTPFQKIVAVPIEKRRPSVRKPFACNKCSFVTHFVHLLKKHCNGHTGMQLNQPHASHRTRTSPRKRMRNIKERTKSDEKRNGPLQPDRTTPRRKLGEIEFVRVKDPPSDDDDSGSTDHIRSVAVIKYIHPHGLFKCKTCGYTNCRMDRVESHVLCSHLYLLPYKCPYCTKDSSNYNTLLQHVSTVHPKRAACVIYRVTSSPQCRKLVGRYIVETTTSSQTPPDGRGTSSVPKSPRLGNVSESAGKPTQIGISGEETDVLPKSDNCDAGSGTHGQGDDGVGGLPKPLAGGETAASVTLWKCQTCRERVMTLNAMKRHLLSHHFGLKSNKCSACEFSACKIEVVDEHIRLWHNDSSDRPTVLNMLDEKSDCLRKMMVMVRRKAYDVSNVDDVEDTCAYVSTVDDKVTETNNSDVEVTCVDTSTVDDKVTETTKSDKEDTCGDVSKVHDMMTEKTKSDLEDTCGDISTVDNMVTEKTKPDLEDTCGDVSTVDDKVTETAKSDEEDTCGDVSTVDDMVTEKTKSDLEDTCGDVFRVDDKMTETAKSDMEDTCGDVSTVDDKVTEKTKSDMEDTCGDVFTVDDKVTETTKFNVEDTCGEVSTVDDKVTETTKSTVEDTCGDVSTVDDKVTETTKSTVEDTCGDFSTVDDKVAETTKCGVEDTCGDVSTVNDEVTETAKSTVEDTCGDVSTVDDKVTETTKSDVEDTCGDISTVDDKATETCNSDLKDSCKQCDTYADISPVDEKVTEIGKTDVVDTYADVSTIDDKVTETSKPAVEDKQRDTCADTSAVYDVTTGGKESHDLPVEPVVRRSDGEVTPNTDCFDRLVEEQTAGSTDSRQTFICVTCGKTMLLEQEMQHHVMVEHLEHRPYKCTLCAHSSAHKRAIQIHTENVHAGKPCSVVYETNEQIEATITEHIVSVSNYTASQPPRSFVCRLCKKYTTSSLCQFLHHVADEMQYKPFQCPHCSYRSIWRNNVKTHIVTNHPQQQIRILLTEDVAQKHRILELINQSAITHDCDEKSDLDIFGDQAD